MCYTDKLKNTDNLISHLEKIVTKIPDQELQANYAGFISVSAVTVYELAIKEIFNEFASKKHKVLGTVVKKYFERLNGKIKLKHLKEEHIKLFGDKYLNKFKKVLDEKEKYMLEQFHTSVCTSYGNLITCRHNYVHNGNPTLTINEAIQFYKDGKEIIHCLNNAMKR